jgi:hypothetical protein
MTSGVMMDVIGRDAMTGTDERIEAFFQDALSFEGLPSAQVRENVRFRIAECERDFADLEIGEGNKIAAAQRCRALCRKRVLDEIDRCKGTREENHWLLVLDVLDSSARFPLRR